MKFGILYEIEVMRPWHERSQYDAFWQAIEQIKVAEEVGFEYVWSVEHHFLDQISLSSAPEVWLAAAAQHTSTIRIGHGVVLLPFNYNHPIRVAERAATLDIMSNGRLEFGTGRSITTLEMEGFGIDPDQTRAEWDEALHMIPRMWTEDEFSWESERIRVPPRNVLPKPLQEPHPPIWAAGTQPATAQVAGERGIGFLHFSLADPVGLDKKVQTYRDAIAKAEPVGKFVNDQFAAFTIMFCGESDEDAFARGGEGTAFYVNMSELLYAAWSQIPTVDQSYDWYKNEFAARGIRAHAIEEISGNHTVCVGGPQTCRETVEWYASQGVDQLIFLVQVGNTRHQDIVDSLRRFGAEVMAPFRESTLAAR